MANTNKKKDYNRAYYAANREKCLAQSKRNRAAKREDYSATARKRHILNAYGLTAEAWDEMFAAQGLCCAICKTATPPVQGWHTDHCHDTNKVRGILCVSCNMGIGQLKHDPIRLAAAIEYLNV